ncbi:MAG TPA: CPBP family intramembrane glutamic endopeptidase, partial [Propionibacteriaceae bacterium]|nr:CPBP family intramembrane glutamic endopeptidase [Propionibacteriaceae bacterium]
GAVGGGASGQAGRETTVRSGGEMARGCSLVPRGAAGAVAGPGRPCREYSARRQHADTPDLGAHGRGHVRLFDLPWERAGEELGWRGFALPHLQDGHSALTATLILGPLWGFWHLPLWLTGSASNPLALFPIFVISVVAVSVLLTWLYNGTEGSLLLVVLLHATANLPITLLITPLGGRAMIMPYACYTVLLIITAAIVAAVNGAAHLSRTHRKQVSEPIETGHDKLPVG